MYMDNSFPLIERFDPEIASLVREEEERQLRTLSLIASENYASPLAVGLEGSILANKNAEGYPGARFVAGCELVDQIEQLAVERAKKLFGAEHANVQSMSATIGNVAVLRALLKPGDTILSMELNQGGHLSHGARFHYSGKQYNAVFYGLNPETERIDMEQVAALAREHRPRLIICGASSYPRLIDYRAFGEIAREVGAYLMADIAHPVGLIAAGVIPSPFPYADVVTSSTHKTWRGSRGGGIILCREELGKSIDRQIFPGLQGAPKMDMIAARAVQLLESSTPEFKAYQETVLRHAKILARELTDNGLRLVTGGTDTHLILVDVRNLIPDGKQAEELLNAVGIVANKNMIPFDPQSPKLTSGLRLGTPAITTRGFSEEEVRRVGRLLADALKHRQQPHRLEEIRSQVLDLAQSHPLFDQKWIPHC